MNINFTSQLLDIYVGRKFPVLFTYHIFRAYVLSV